MKLWASAPTDHDLQYLNQMAFLFFEMNPINRPSPDDMIDFAKTRPTQDEIIFFLTGGNPDEKWIN